ncbi:MAG: (d)CMP kinase [Hyphomonas sp.]|uniref:(d)CMP kinase n=1 Tax=Hyphomonas sp. TaxID=87 RepID=UPI0017B4D375|nr:(d)CMP kinase [Hyphomonas sp.]MBU3920252.1 (d)CMP kinase [Alphaproteobacteria bacterium]MBA3067409.1 (d)CMP kinase [Hyphomonas sp.]MBU4061039.1 (d)CMP kinase [Alphaproteobacteria bacterium]MBU4165895.1 (d)CMP kinase [Alphaproteobacteria bacterium]MBU4569172.1 (d)CMP kinase [Alphaproteobacteria bacterium]
MIIAIDGTTASGKGTIAKRLSGYYGLPHMDTGRLYRAVGVAAVKHGVALDAAGPLADIARTLDLNDFIEHELRSAEAGKAASVVAAIPSVRQALFELQRAFATQAGGALLDGRDIGTVIAPDADVKLWVDADVIQRSVRRWKELVGQGDMIPLETVVEQLKTRDARDQGRSDAPAAMAADAILIDTTDLTIDAAVEKALAAVEAALARGKTA